MSPYVRRMKAVVLDDSYRALAHPVRRDLLRLISDGERSVGELVDGTGLAQPIVGQQLRVLRDASLVAVRVDGNRRLYSIDFARLAELRSFLDQFWTDELDALRRVAEEEDS
jgi:DNA-binding transcriptional ArsR family regulator